MTHTPEVIMSRILHILLLLAVLAVLFAIVGMLSEAIIPTPETILGDAWCSPPETC